MSKLKVHIGADLEASKRRVLDAVERAQKGEIPGETHVTFADWSVFWEVMTARRYEMLRHLHRQPEASIAALARSLKRDYKRVHTDVEALVKAGLIERTAEGLRADYDEIRATIPL
jgi:predicted transcriptional regulator